MVVSNEFINNWWHQYPIPNNCNHLQSVVSSIFYNVGHPKPIEFCFLLNYVVLGFLLLLRTLKSIVEISVGMFKTIITMLLSIHQSIWMIATSFVIHSYNIPIKKYHIIHSQICCGRQNNLSNACKQVTISSYLILLFLLQASSN